MSHSPRRKPDDAASHSPANRRKSEKKQIAFEQRPSSGTIQRAVTDPSLLSPSDVLALQRTVGNTAVQRLLAGRAASQTPTAPLAEGVGTGQVIQPKLTVGPARDSYEIEADQIANQVVRSPETPPAQRDRDEEDSAIQRAPAIRQVQRSAPIGLAGGALDSKLEGNLRRAQNGGSALPDGVRRTLEPKLGADLSGVKVHTDTQAAQISRDLDAKAFTHKNHIYYGAGQSPSNLQLTAHETVHTIQQGAVQQTPAQRMPLHAQAGNSADKANLPTIGRAISPAVPAVQTKLYTKDEINSRKMSKQNLLSKPVESAPILIKQKEGKDRWIRIIVSKLFSKATLQSNKLGHLSLGLPTVHLDLEVRAKKLGMWNVVNGTLDLYDAQEFARKDMDEAEIRQRCELLVAFIGRKIQKGVEVAEPFLEGQRMIESDKQAAQAKLEAEKQQAKKEAKQKVKQEVKKEVKDQANQRWRGKQPTETTDQKQARIKAEAEAAAQAKLAAAPPQAQVASAQGQIIAGKLQSGQQIQPSDITPVTDAMKDTLANSPEAQAYQQTFLAAKQAKETAAQEADILANKAELEAMFGPISDYDFDLKNTKKVAWLAGKTFAAKKDRNELTAGASAKKKFAADAQGTFDGTTSSLSKAHAEQPLGRKDKREASLEKRTGSELFDFTGTDKSGGKEVATTGVYDPKREIVEQGDVTRREGNKLLNEAKKTKQGVFTYISAEKNATIQKAKIDAVEFRVEGIIKPSEAIKPIMGKGLLGKQATAKAEEFERNAGSGTFEYILKGVIETEQETHWLDLDTLKFEFPNQTDKFFENIIQQTLKSVKITTGTDPNIPILHANGQEIPLTQASGKIEGEQVGGRTGPRGWLEAEKALMELIKVIEQEAAKNAASSAPAPAVPALPNVP